MSTSSTAGPRNDAATSIRRGRRAWWLAGMLLAASGCAASLALLPTTAQAQPQGAGQQRGATTLVGRTSSPGSAISAFCAHFPAKTVSSTVGANEWLFKAVIENSSYECIFEPTSASGWEVIISMNPKIPSAEVATLQAAEASFSAKSPKGVKVLFTALPSLGPTAFSWTYAKPVNGGRLVGVADNTKTTGFGVVMGRGAKTFGTAAAHVPVLERLLKLDMAA